MMKFTNRILAKCFFWFGITLAIFAVTTQMSGRIKFASPFFYLELGILALLAGILVLNEDK